MSPTLVLALKVSGVVIAFWVLALLVVVGIVLLAIVWCENGYEKEAPKLPHVPPMTATWPARNIEVNGFRYVLDTCACGKPKGSCGCGA